MLPSSLSTALSGTATCTARPGASGVVSTMACTPSSVVSV